MQVMLTQEVKEFISQKIREEVKKYFSSQSAEPKALKQENALVAFPDISAFYSSSRRDTLGALKDLEKFSQQALGAQTKSLTPSVFPEFVKKEVRDLNGLITELENLTQLSQKTAVQSALVSQSIEDRMRMLYAIANKLLPGAKNLQRKG